jgi:hypothetical protein
MRHLLAVVAVAALERKALQLAAVEVLRHQVLASAVLVDRVWFIF